MWQTIALQASALLLGAVGGGIISALVAWRMLRAETAQNLLRDALAIQAEMEAWILEGPSYENEGLSQRKGLPNIEVIQEKKQGRSPGWTKVKSTDRSRRGSVNMQWNGVTNILTCRVINKGAGQPNLIIGDFVDYLLNRHRKRMKLLTVLPG